MAFSIPFLTTSIPKGKASKVASAPRPWSANELRQLKTMAKQGTPLRTISLQLQRSTEAIIVKAKEEQIELPRAASAVNGTLASQF